MKTVRVEEKLERVFPGNSKMARRIRAFDWSQSALGPIGSWPPALRSALAVMLGSPHPMLLWWGRQLSQLTQFCNDRYAELMLGAQQPCLPGRPARFLSDEAWHRIGPRVQAVVRSGNAAVDEELLLILERKGYPEETYHDLAYVPIPDETGNVGGVACHINERTQQVLDRRRRRLLDSLAAQLDAGLPPEAALRAAGEVLAAGHADIPFALAYVIDGASGAVRLCMAAGLQAGAPGAAPQFPHEALAAEADGWALGKVMATGRPEVVSRLGRRFGALPGGAWPEPADTAVVAPILHAARRLLAGFLICGVSPRREADESYLAFCEGLAAMLASAFGAGEPSATALDRPAVPAGAGEVSERAGIEEALRRSEARLAIELAAMSRLHDLSSRLLTTTDMQSALREVLDAALVMLGAAMGVIQLYNPVTRTLEVVVQRSFAPEILGQFRELDVEEMTVCATAARSRTRVVVDDVTRHPGYPALHAAALVAGFRGMQSTPLISRDGSLLGVLSTYFRQVHAPSERELRMLDLYAIQAVDQIARIRAEEALKEADRRKDEFIATLAHELRNPLAPIRNAILMLRQAQHTGGLEHLQRVLERQVEHMVRLVDDLMEVSRITTGKIELRKTSLRLAEVLAHAVETSMPNIERARHRLSVSPADEELLLEGDAVRLEQVFANLLNNAAKYTEEGGDIRLRAWREGLEALIEVSDNGIGIAPAMLPHVFDLFAQTGDAAGRWQGGIGIGLYLVRRLVEMHGGTVEASSAGCGLGSRFVVRLPLIAGSTPQVDNMAQEAYENAPVRPTEATQSGELVRRRVLIVDDNHDAAESLAMLLEHFGAHVQVAHDGPAALRALEGGEPDAVLLDIGMPGMDGYAVARRIRAQPRLRRVLLVALSGWGGEEDRRRSQECGFDHHLVKPVDFAELRRLLNAP